MLSFLFLVLLPLCTSLTFQIEPKSTVCLHESLDAGQAVSASWEVVRGGLLDINILITGPTGEVYHKELFFEGRGSDGLKHFGTGQSGRYSFCFDNEMSRWTPKVVSFSLVREAGSSDDDDADDDALSNLARPEDTQRLLHRISKISGQVARLETEQTYYRKREHRHRNTAESTCTRVLYWSIGETIVLAGISIGQVFVLRKWFDKRPAGGGGV